ncbi:permease [Bacillus haynesii]|uniref:permease n=1 Tax=Bacillus haynesii TaxID=1925021 RepID=UPI00227DB592|nr:permease [Bacillus haynesii]MCY7769204.1 permease [Bacillus haynesii]MCY8011653.1 permease [Bacillus haynesii]MCY9215192.1 permease [Bacillus haynesii]MEC0762742.1 permease [Bacillus haynesii]MEC0781942.1 permease [Bacillus haynesii]
MNSRLGNFIMSFLMLGVSLYLFFSNVVNGKSGDEIVYLLFSLFIMFFALGYLHPQFKKKDERFKLIQQKSMFFTYFILMGYFFIFTMLLGYNIINLSALGAIKILGALTIATLNLLLIIFSKIY